MEKYIINKLPLPYDIKTIIISFFPDIHSEIIERFKQKYWFKKISINDRFYFYESQLSLGGDRRLIGGNNEFMLKSLFKIEKTMTNRLNKKTIMKMHKRNIETCHLRNVFTIEFVMLACPDKKYSLCIVFNTLTKIVL